MKRAVLVYADGRTSSVEAHGFGNWYVQPIPPPHYRAPYTERYFKNIGFASDAKSPESGGPLPGCFVFVQRSKEEYDRG